eukprot:scaffold96792_cov69-Phaeocystis_antarctica.AAC.1
MVLAFRALLLAACGTFLPTATSCASGSYSWIGASAGTDAWCNSNCNYTPSWCPATTCKCNDLSISPPPTPPPPPPPLPSTCGSYTWIGESV